MPSSIIALDIAHPQTLQVKMQDPESFKNTRPQLPGHRVKGECGHPVKIQKEIHAGFIASSPCRAAFALGMSAEHYVSCSVEHTNACLKPCN